MASPNDKDHLKLLAREKAAGEKASRALQTRIRHLIAIETVRSTGDLLKTNVQPFVDDKEGLTKIYINGPHYGYKLNYGFIGVREGGRLMRLRETAHIANPIEKTNIVPMLATEIGEIRADKVVATIKF
jgi:hypothetical protein